MQIKFANLRRGDVDVVRARQVVVIWRSQEPESIGERFQHALGEDQAALLGPRFEDLEDQLLLPHAGRSRHVELLRNLRERSDAHILERGKIDALYFLGGGGA